jgi:dTDP-4-dehydrorhamnose 3,5-epimerase
VRVLVTGTEGCLGCLVAPTLLQDGHDVVGLDTGYYQAGWLCPGHLANSAHPAAPFTLIKDIRHVTVDGQEGFRFNDPAFGIDWPLPVTVISEKDTSWPLLAPAGSAAS